MNSTHSSIINNLSFIEYFSFDYPDEDALDSWKVFGVSVCPFTIGHNEKYTHHFVKSKPTGFQSAEEYNLYLAHQKALAYFVADSSNFHKTVMFVQDVALAADADKYLKTLTYLSDKFDWDMMYLDTVHNAHSYLPTNNQNLLRLSGSTGWKAVLITYKTAELLLEQVEDTPYDLYCASKIHHKLRCYGFYPSLISKKGRFNK